MDISSVNAAVQVGSKAMSALNEVRERAQASQDVELKARLSFLYDQMLLMQEATARLVQENRELRRTSENKGKLELRLVGNAKFYFDNDKGPYCQPCYEAKGMLTELTEPQEWNGGIRRRCVHCKDYFYEKPTNWQSGSLPSNHGPNSWMR